MLRGPRYIDIVLLEPNRAEKLYKSTQIHPAFWLTPTVELASLLESGGDEY